MATITGRRMSGTAGVGTLRPPGGAWARRWAAATAAPAFVGLVTAWSIPRGPMTAAEAVGSVVLCLAAGTIAGRWSRSRAAVLVAPAVFVAAVELTRIDILGPTVDQPSLSLYGTMALALGRGVHGLYSVLPLSLGAAYGAAWAARSRPRRGDDHRPPGCLRLLRRLAMAVTSLVVLGATGLAFIPGRTAAIVGSNGAALPRSIAELTRIHVGDHDLGLMLRGRDATTPVLLYLAGGPGGSELGAMRADAGLEQHFVVATWDQRGTGTSYGALDPTSTLTLASAVDDTIAVAESLRDRFAQERIVVVGQSYGSLLAVLAAQRRPDLFHAVVGTGQMVSVLETDRAFYRDTLAWARRAGRADVVADLERIGPPPYADLLDYELALSFEHEVYPYDHSRNAEGPGGFSEHIAAEEYTPLQRAHNLVAFLDTFAVLYPQLQGLDLRRTASSLEVPVLLVQGRHEPAGRADLAREWFTGLQAPWKGWVELDTSGHRPIFEQPGPFVESLVEHVLPVARR